MGVFDSVYFRCPNCGSPVEGQSKSGECRLVRYDASMVPVDVVAGLRDSLTCEKCNQSFDVVKPQFVQLWLGVAPKQLNIDGEYE